MPSLGHRPRKFLNATIGFHCCAGVNRAFSAGDFSRDVSPGALPQAHDEYAPLALVTEPIAAILAEMRADRRRHLDILPPALRHRRFRRRLSLRRAILCSRRETSAVVR